uniref:Uncharacterized protein n=1 Tax=Xenopus tropicalis TaxID=8364 RepID=A0A6I8QV45_XENTR
MTSGGGNDKVALGVGRRGSCLAPLNRCALGSCLFCLPLVPALEKRAMPNWSMSASDFYGWVEELRQLAAYDKSEELARIYWAHFPVASQLGYDVPEQEE